MQQLTFLYGFLAVLQMLFLPGYLILKILRLQLGIVRSGLICVSLSLLSNYVLVWALVLAGYYTPEVLRVIVFAELVVVLLLLLISRKPMRAFYIDGLQIRAFARSCLIGNNGWQTFARFAVLTLAVACLLSFARMWFMQLGQIFTAWDPVMSYNAWAKVWATNQIPAYTWHYPQLLPINWSLSYVLMGSSNGNVDLELFAKSIMPIFSFLLTLNVAWLAIEKRAPGYLLGAVLTSMLLYILVGANLGQGWVDVGVAFETTLGISMLLVVSQHVKHYRRWLWLTAVIIAAGAVTKQAGIYLLLAYPLLGVLILREAKWPQGYKKHLLGSWLLALLIALPWYAFIQWRIDHGLAASEIGFVTSTIYQTDLMVNVRYVWPFFLLGIHALLVFVLAGAYSRRRVVWRYIAWVVVFPYALIWFLWFSYSLRNVTWLLPLISCMAGLELWQAAQKGQWLSRWVIRAGQWLSQYRPWHLLVAMLMVATVISTTPYYYGNQLNLEQYKSKLNLGLTEVNWQLLHYHHVHGFDGKIVTSWDYLGHVPLLKQFYLPWQPATVEANPTQSSWMSDPGNLPSVLKQHPARYILAVNIGGLMSSKFERYLKKLRQLGILQVRMEVMDFTLYEIMDKNFSKWPAPSKQKHHLKRVFADRQLFYYSLNEPLICKWYGCNNKS